MKKELLHAAMGLGLFLLLLGGLVAYRAIVGTDEPGPIVDPKTYLGDEILPPRPAPEFDLIDRNGERLELDDLRGRVILLSFAYTNCADICPILFGSFIGVERQLGPKIGKEVELVFITLDPLLDTPERLEAATEAVGGNWHFLTEEQSILEQVWKDYRVYRKRVEGVVDHSGLTYLIDTQGLMRTRYFGTPPGSVLAADIDELLGHD